MHRNIFQKHFKRHQVAFFFFLLHLMPKLIFLCLKLASFCFLFTIQFNFSRIALDQEEKNIILHLFKYMPFSSSCSIEVGTTQIFIPRISAFFLNLPKSHKNMPNFISCIECFFFVLPEEIEWNFL